MLLAHSGMAALTGAGLSGGKTYADWMAHIATVATGGSRAEYDSVGAVGAYRVVLSAAAWGSGLYGSSWQSFFALGPSSKFRSVIQHGMPTQATFEEQDSDGREVLVRITSAGGRQVFTPLNRNGFQSIGGDTGGAVPAGYCTAVAWWDEATKAALQMDPQAGTGPLPYTAPGWVI